MRRCVCGHREVEHVERQEDCVVEGCGCEVFVLDTTAGLPGFEEVRGRERAELIAWARRDGCPDGNAGCNSLIEELANALEAAEQQIDEMREYVDHDLGCSAPFGEDVYPCKCGLARLRAGWTV